jgi:hypothetical protein
VPGRAAGTQRHQGAREHRAPVADEPALDERALAGPAERAARPATDAEGQPLAALARTHGPAVTSPRSPGKASIVVPAARARPVLLTRPVLLAATLLATIRRAGLLAPRPEINLDVIGLCRVAVMPAGPRVRRVPARVRLRVGDAPASSATQAGPPIAKIFAVAGVQPPMGPAGPLEPRRAASSGTPTGRHPGVSSVPVPAPLLVISATAPGPLLMTTPAVPRGPRGVTVLAAQRRLLTVAASAAGPGRRRVTTVVARPGPRQAGPDGPRRATAHATGILDASAADLDVMTDVTTGATATGGHPARTTQRRATDPAGQTILVPAPAPAGRGPQTPTAIPTAVARDPVPAGPVPPTAAVLAVKTPGRPPPVLPTGRLVLPRTVRLVLLPTVRLVLLPTVRSVLPRTGRPVLLPIVRTALLPIARLVLPRTVRTALLPTGRLVAPRTVRPVPPQTVRTALLPTGRPVPPQTVRTALPPIGRLVAPRTVRPGRPGRMARLLGLPAAREDRRAMAVVTAHRGRIADAEVTGRRSVPEAGDPRPGLMRGAVPGGRLRRTNRVRPAHRFLIRSAPSSLILKLGLS